MIEGPGSSGISASPDIPSMTVKKKKGKIAGLFKRVLPASRDDARQQQGVAPPSLARRLPFTLSGRKEAAGHLAYVAAVPVDRFAAFEMQSDGKGSVGILSKKEDDEPKKRDTRNGDEDVKPPGGVRPDPAGKAVSMREYDGGLGFGQFIIPDEGGSRLPNEQTSTSARNGGTLDAGPPGSHAVSGVRFPPTALARNGSLKKGDIEENYDSVGNYNSLANYESVGNYNSIAGYASKGSYISLAKSNTSQGHMPATQPSQGDDGDAYNSVGNYNTLDAYNSVGAYNSTVLGRYNTRKPLSVDVSGGDSYGTLDSGGVAGEYNTRQSLARDVAGTGAGAGAGDGAKAGARHESTLGFDITVGEGSSDSLRKLYAAAESAYKAGRMETAIGALGCALEAVALLPSSSGDPDDDRCMILRRMAMVHVASGDYSAAEVRLKECILLGESLWARRIPTHELPLALCQMGNLRKDQRQLPSASGYFEAAANRWRSHFGNKPDKRLLYALNGQAQALGRMGQLMAAEELAGKVVSMARRLNLPELPGYVRNHGIVKKLLQKYGAVADFAAMAPPPTRPPRPGAYNGSSMPPPTRSAFAVIQEDSMG